MTHPETPAQRRKRAAMFRMAARYLDEAAADCGLSLVAAFTGMPAIWFDEFQTCLTGRLYMWRFDDNCHRATALGIYAAMIEAGDA